MSRREAHHSTSMRDECTVEDCVGYELVCSCPGPIPVAGHEPPLLADNAEEAQRMAYGGRSLPSLKEARKFDTERLSASPLFARKLF